VVDELGEGVVDGREDGLEQRELGVDAEREQHEEEEHAPELRHRQQAHGLGVRHERQALALLNHLLQ